MPLGLLTDTAGFLTQAAFSGCKLTGTGFAKAQARGFVVKDCRFADAIPRGADLA